MLDKLLRLFPSGLVGLRVVVVVLAAVGVENRFNLARRELAVLCCRIREDANGPGTQRGSG